MFLSLFDLEGEPVAEVLLMGDGDPERRWPCARCRVELYATERRIECRACFTLPIFCGECYKAHVARPEHSTYCIYPKLRSS